MFGNIIYIIIVLVIFQLDYPGEGLFKSGLTVVLDLFLLWLGFTLYCKHRFSRLLRLWETTDGGAIRGHLSTVYQSVVARLSILSVVLFAVSVYLFDLKYWLLRVPGFAVFSILPSAVALVIFSSFLMSIWYFGYPVHTAFSGYPMKRWLYVGSNIKLNVPILFPWATLTVCYDLLALLSWPWFRRIFDSEIGQFGFFSLFLVLLAIILPPFIKYWWGCSTLPETEKKQSMVAFFRRQGFKYRDILRWPILEGRMMTAGVMGLLWRFRYILITDSLLQVLSKEELNAVMAHEMGHIRYRHLLFYVFFLLGYMALSFGFFDVIFYAMAAQPWLFGLLKSQQDFQTGIFYSFLTLPIILSVIIYFRYIMGFFMRHFERQADCYSVRLLGRAEPTIMSLEKIAGASGQSRHHPSWHHFSIAERVDFLWKSRQDTGLMKRHSRRLGVFLTIFFVLLISLGYSFNFGPLKPALEKLALERILNQQLEESDKGVEVYRGLAAVYHKIENLARAQWAYENIISLDPDDGLALNNLAWILATAEDETLRDYPRALILAQKAAGIERSPTVLDTLAEAYYVNKLFDQALQTIREALDVATENRQYLIRQMKKFEKKAALEDK